MLKRKISFISGIICGLSFAPIYFIPGIFTLSILCSQIYYSKTRAQASRLGYWYGFGFFLSSLYWISFGVMVYIDQFWWAVPFALFGLPAFLGIFIAIVASVAWQFRSLNYYHIIFCIIWLFIEWLMSWIFTGLPWSMLGYALTISDIMIQSASIFGILGLSFVTLLIGTTFYKKKLLALRAGLSLIIISIMLMYGIMRLAFNPTEYSEIKIRIVQPSIQQLAKWNPDEFWDNFNKHISMSQRAGEPDIIIWSEAALTVPFYFPEILNNLKSVFTKDNQFLLTGTINDNGLSDDKFELYSSFVALDNKGELIFDYHKSHLVPFGEYIPFSDFIPIKKITPGIIDYASGSRKTVTLPALNLVIQPLICYESIFFAETSILNNNADAIFNITNDAWYGNSSGPYQHFQISRIRAVENALPMVRSANNGISAITDPLGRIVAKIELNNVDILDWYLPTKLNLPTLFSRFGILTTIVFIFIVLILHNVGSAVTVRLNRKNIFT